MIGAPLDEQWPGVFLFHARDDDGFGEIRQAPVVIRDPSLVEGVVGQALLRAGESHISQIERLHPNLHPLLQSGIRVANSPEVHA